MPNHVATSWFFPHETVRDGYESHRMTDHVSRETPSAPASARGVFLQALPQVEQYATLLAEDATVRGLIGPREVPRIWERHLLNCGVITELIPEGSSVADIGSGAGLPGVVLALRRPDLLVTLVEPLLRRTTFLDLVVERMGLENVVVRRGRAEELHGEVVFDVVTSRAVAPMERLARWSLPLVAEGGLFLAMKGSSATEELAQAAGTVRDLGGADPRVELVGGQWLTPAVTVVAMRKRSGSSR